MPGRQGSRPSVPLLDVDQPRRPVVEIAERPHADSLPLLAGLITFLPHANGSRGSVIALNSDADESAAIPASTCALRARLGLAGDNRHEITDREGFPAA